MTTTDDDVIYRGNLEIMEGYQLKSLSMTKYWIRQRAIPVYKEGKLNCSTKRLRDDWLADRETQALAAWKEGQRLASLRRPRGRPTKEETLRRMAMGVATP